ncbi:glycoside hydrolase family 5 protein [Aplosporella prunicola CBS 121167]|uniref:glucan 1,3-beta-glucosidase n=1 Tax=Aplosporella prunicola CBS 121167 TaxID=1176127 RepID=A0A6A6BRA5_9PEZI|nr:glycoside hydrolase family 5 protein [Aplosporella prunicola CBS 121167]KAF2145983.1 glycoside hydrolase family 5 protein [Aplosporella prunicola CBS 121167]
MARFLLPFFAILVGFVGTLLAYPTSTSGEVASPYLRGVNLGGWLVLESYLTPELFEDDGVVDQWTFDEQPGSFDKLKTHWDTYCTEADIKKLASYGINAVRIPIGFWAYDNDDTPYHKGSDKYLRKAIKWARDAGMVVIIDLHATPGSQNGDIGSGHIQDGSEWQTGAGNMERTTTILETIAEKYGNDEFANVVVAIELVNEPSNNAPNTLEKTKKWTKSTFADVRNAATNKNLRIAMHDQWVTPKNWLDVNSDLSAANPGMFVMDVHQYQIFTDEDKHLDQQEHIQKVCKFAEEQLKLAKDNDMLLTVGEFSGNTFICVNSNGTTFADPNGEGKACNEDGCQCELYGGISVDDWSDQLVEQVRRYIEVQLDIFEEYAESWFFWNFKGPGSWGFMTGVEKGFIPQPLTSRRYPNPCN